GRPRAPGLPAVTGTATPSDPSPAPTAPATATAATTPTATFTVSNPDPTATLTAGPSSTPTATSMPNPNDWTWQQPSLDGGGTAVFTATMQLVQSPPGDAIVASAQATAAGLSGAASHTGGAIVVQRGLGNGTARFTPGSPAHLQSLDGRVQVDIPPNAADRPLNLQHSLNPGPGDVTPPEIAGRRRGFGTYYLIATDDQGQRFHQFAAPLTVTVSYTPQQLQALGIWEGDLSLFWYDPN